MKNPTRRRGVRPQRGKKGCRGCAKKDRELSRRYDNAMWQVFKEFSRLVGEDLGVPWYDQYVEISRGELKVSITPYEPPTRLADGELSGDRVWSVNIALPADWKRAKRDPEYRTELARELAIDYLATLEESKNTTAHLDLLKKRDALLQSG